VQLRARYWSKNELKDRYIPILGEGGLFIASVDPLPLGTVLDLEISLASQGVNFNVKGEVVWINQDEDPARRGMGIKFLNLSYEQKQIIYSLVDDTLRQHLLERRRFARVDAQLEVQFVYAEGFFSLRTEDLSVSGMFIATDHLVPVGERLQLVLHLPGKLPVVKAVCEVMRVVEDPAPGRPAGMGVKFVKIDRASLDAIRRFLAEQVSGEVTVGQDRRRSARLRRQVKLRFQWADSLTTSIARDISRTGVFIHTISPPPVGASVLVSLTNPVTSQKLELPGRVVRVVEPDPVQPRRLPGAGVEFVGLSEQQQEMLRRFVRDFALYNGEKSSEKNSGGQE